MPGIGIKIQYTFPLMEAGEEQALIDLRLSLQGDRWVTSSSPSTWLGITFDANGRVSAVELQNLNLEGSIPSSLSTLSLLKELRLSGNRICGEIPVTLTCLHAIRILDLSCNLMSGPLLPLFSLSNLEELILTGNSFEGNLLCDEVKAFSKLTRLDIVGNAFSGEISPSLHSLCKLENLHIAKNQFTSGSEGFQVLDFPPGMSSLTEIDMSGNKC